MNKKELVKALTDRMQKFGYFPSFTNVKIFIQEYEKLTKSGPLKPVVPQFVADWYEEHKDDFDYRLWSVIYNDGQGDDTEISNWICETENALIILVNMHQFGYEVEKEKRYRVNMFGLSNKNCCLVKNLGLYKFGCETDGNSKHTRKELEEAGFGWVFDCPGVEVQEVEE